MPMSESRGESQVRVLVDEWSSGLSLEVALCRTVYEQRAAPMLSLCKAFEGHGVWKVRRAIARLRRTGCVVVPLLAAALTRSQKAPLILFFTYS